MRDPLAHFDNHDLRADLNSALETLSPEERTAVILWLNGTPLTTLSRAHHLSARQLQTAMAAVRHHLKDYRP